MLQRQPIVSAAGDIALCEGFEAVTTTRLAIELDLSDDDVASYFATDEALQQSIVHAGADIFREHVTDRADSAADGIEKLRALMLRWVDYAEGDAYRGGFVGGAASLPAHVTEVIASIAQSWVDTLAEHADIAVGHGTLPEGTDPRQVAFELHGLVQEANWTFGVLGDKRAYDRARRGIEHRLGPGPGC